MPFILLVGGYTLILIIDRVLFDAHDDDHNQIVEAILGDETINRSVKSLVSRGNSFISNAANQDRLRNSVLKASTNPNDQQAQADVRASLIEITREIEAGKSVKRADKFANKMSNARSSQIKNKTDNNHSLAIKRKEQNELFMDNKDIKMDKSLNYKDLKK